MREWQDGGMQDRGECTATARCGVTDGEGE